MRGIREGIQSVWVACVVLAGGVGAAQAPASPPTAAERGFDHSHAAWTAVLERRVHAGGLVDYRGLRRERAAFDAYLAELEAVQAEQMAAWKPQQREAYWINAYNAYAIQLVLDEEPERSIKELGGLFSSVFDHAFIPLQHLSPDHDEPLSLGELEHEVLYPRSRTPLFHFAIVCASTSCPELLDRAYTAERLDRQLAARARAFLADPAKNDQRAIGGKLRISKIFDWAEDELEQYPGGIRAILREYGPETWTADDAFATVRLKYRSYDWSLNRWTPKDSNR